MRPRMPIGGIGAAALCLGVQVASAQEHGAQPYAGLEARPVKALSEQQTADLRAGRGMGLALSAELNGYPGPSHALELAHQLALSADQRTRLQELFDRMKSEAVPIGERLIVQEGELEQQFATRAATLASLEAATASIGATQAALRAAHLKYHLSTLAVLTPTQVERYAQLRGYTGKTGAEPRHGGHQR